MHYSKQTARWQNLNKVELWKFFLEKPFCLKEVASTVRTFLTEFLTSHLKTLATQMGYPIGVFI